ncbi:MAG: C4-dicarboxylate ABC transporter [Candidatus Acididesulfobacter diazotrophicus]|uniref:C4-dicarboxylate ABC transporter n=1 Tax=Candidatus Acididesulfobacter diazotrophicus TaxID=2597226 RepID=A0A519BKM6_9DELT|nr:MAG: C4-dicarboxylate ABC transporter [Candidatus Acididesulfobacter diazotrophicus]
MEKIFNSLVNNIRPLKQISHPADLIKQFTPNWFAMNMGTGILSLMLAAFPYPFKGLHIIAESLWIINIILFIIFSILFISRFIFYFNSAKRLLSHPIQSMFLGAIPMGLATIINGFLIFDSPKGVTLALNLWWFDAFISIIVGILVPFYMFTNQKHSIEDMTAIWLLPIVPAEVAAASAGFLAQHVSAAIGRHVIILGYALWAFSVPLAFGILVILFLRLAWHKLPHKDMAVSTWITLGPIGTGSLGVLLLGNDAPRAFIGTKLFVYAKAAHAIGPIGGLVIWGFGFWWLIMAISMTFKYMKEGLPFNMGWWGFTFPLGVYTAATITLYRLTNLELFRVAGAIFIVMLAIFWAVVTLKTLPGIWHGYLFKAPCLSEETGLPDGSEECIELDR